MNRAVRSPLATPAIDDIWRRAAGRVGFAWHARRDAYATSDGRGGIAIGATETLDDDDAFAQLVFHELCHAITEGEGALRKPDWGLDNFPEHAVREHACLRVQARSGGSLRPARGDGADDAVSRITTRRCPRIRWRPSADEAEAAARARRGVRALRGVGLARARSRRRWRETAAAIGAGQAAHPLGFALGPDGARAAATAPGCYEGGRGPAVARCRQSAPANGDGARTARNHPACARWEPRRRLPHLRRLLPRGLPFGDGVDARSGGLAGARADRAPRRALRDPREGPRCAALEADAGQQLRLHDLREPPAALPRVRRRRPALPGRAPARRPEREAGPRRAAGRAAHDEPLADARWLRPSTSFVPLGRARRSAGAARGARARAGRAARPATLRVLRRSLDARKGRPLGQRLRVLVGARGETLDAGRRARRAARRAGRRDARRRGWSSSARARRDRGRRCAWRRRAFRSPSSSRASRCSRAAAIWRCSRAGELDAELELLLRRGRRGDLLGRQALHPRQGSRRRSPTSSPIWSRFGAPADIAVEARPHVGSNRLPRRAPRRCARTSSAPGVEYRFETDVAGLRVARRARARACASRAATSSPADAVVLAVGHSARADVRVGRRPRGVAARAQAVRGRRAHRASAAADRRASSTASAAGHPKLPRRVLSS